MKNLLLLASACLILTCNLYAQFQGPVYLPNAGVKVYAYGNEQTLAWCGGFNNPQVQMADLNNDGRQDMVMFEPYLGVRTFINTGTDGNPLYSYAPEYALNFPRIHDYLILKDYNCDNVADLFSNNGGSGFSASRGYYNSKNQLCFQFYKNLYYTNDTSTSGAANAYNNPGDIPAIVDVDNDGDLDFLSYYVTGGNIYYYKNIRAEKHYPCDSIIIELRDRCWGHVYQAYWRTHIIPFNCDESKLNILPGTKVTHQGNTLCLFDYDGDGDYDYLDGSISFNELTFLQNGKIPYNPAGTDSMVYQDTMWPKAGHTIELPLWPAAFNVDVDQDGKNDIIVTPNAANTSENYSCIWYYKNLSTPGHPSYVFQSDSFMVDKSIDLGTGAYPTLFDYNKDGKPDLFIGSDGYYLSSGGLKSKVSYYMNTSTPGAPSFTLQTKDFMNINNYDFQGAALAMGDLDNDGIQDMVIGHSNGTVSFFKNTATSNAVQPNWQISELTLIDADNKQINVGNKAAPFIYDINKDGKPDLLIGSYSGTLTYYQNVSTTPNVILLKFITSKLGGVKADPKLNFGGQSTPYIGPIDNTGRDYLLLGSNSGNIYRYDSFQNGNVTTPYKLIDSQYSYIDSTYLIYNSSRGEYGGLRSAPVVGDIDGDGKHEMFVGMIYGGVQLYKEDKIGTGVTNINSAPSPLNIQVYPNPAKGNITIAFDKPLPGVAELTIVNMAGQTLETAAAGAGQTKISIPLQNWPAGMYVCVVNANNQKYYNKFTILK